MNYDGIRKVNSSIPLKFKKKQPCKYNCNPIKSYLASILTVLWVIDITAQVTQGFIIILLNILRLSKITAQRILKMTIKMNYPKLAKLLKRYTLWKILVKEIKWVHNSNKMSRLRKKSSLGRDNAVSIRR